MNPKTLLSIVLVAASTVGSLQFGCRQEDNRDKRAATIRVGWQIPWATQGQVVQSLKHTNILRLNDLKADFKGFSYGGPLNEAALAGEVDVILTADQPAAMLLARGARWTIVGRLMYNRVAIYVPPRSTISDIPSLKGKRIAMPYGAAAQRVALKVIEAAGLDPKKDIESFNLDIFEQTSVVQAGSDESWGKIDALVGFDPTPAIFEYKKQARMLHVGQVVSLVLISDEYLTKQRAASKRFLKSFVEAWFYYATHEPAANGWFKTGSRLEFDTAVLDICASVEPNVRAKTIADIRTTLNESDLKVVQEAATFIHRQELVKVHVMMAQHIDQSLMRDVLAELRSKPYDATQIKVTP